MVQLPALFWSTFMFSSSTYSNVQTAEKEQGAKPGAGNRSVKVLIQK